jgi:tetratricopeptide (TPR) repeat protein
MKSLQMKWATLGSLLIFFLLTSGFVSDYWPQTVSEEEGVLEEARQLNNQGVAFYHDRKLPEALASFVMAASLDKHFWQGHYNCAIVLAAMGKTEKALHHLDLSLDIDPYNPMTLAFYIDLLDKVNRGA